MLQEGLSIIGPIIERLLDRDLIPDSRWISMDEKGTQLGSPPAIKVPLDFRWKFSNDNWARS